MYTMGSMILGFWNQVRVFEGRFKSKQPVLILGSMGRGSQLRHGRKKSLEAPVAEAKIAQAAGEFGEVLSGKADLRVNLQPCYIQIAVDMCTPHRYIYELPSILWILLGGSRDLVTTSYSPTFSLPSWPHNRCTSYK